MFRTPFLLIFLLTVFSNTSFAQSMHYYGSEGVEIQLSYAPNRFLVSTNERVQLNHFGNCDIDTIKRNLYLIDDTSCILNKIGIDYVTQGLKFNNSTPIFVSKDITFLFKDDCSQTKRDSIYALYNLQFIKKASSYELARVPNTGDAIVIANSIYESGLVIHSSPDFLVRAQATEHIPNDTYFNQQWYLHNTGQGANDGKSTTVDADIDAPEAWEITKGSADIVIAVIDEGLSSNHPDLPNSRQVRLNGSNFAYQYDGTGDPNNPSPNVSTTQGKYYHGDACAGIIAATQDNNEGISGIAPLCKIMPVKILIDYFGDIFVNLSTYTDAFEFARINEVQIISNSWGIDGMSAGFSPSLELEINAAINQGIIIVFAAGNTADHSNNYGGNVIYPANASIPNMIVVGASDRNNTQANYSPTDNLVDIAAPSHTAYDHQIEGQTDESFNIWTMDIPGANYGQNSWRDNTTITPFYGEILPSTGTNYEAYTGRFGGTSAAAPMVAGTVALMKSINPCLTPFQIIKILELTADKVGGYDYQWNANKTGHSKELGFGKLNTFRAVQMALDLETLAFDLYMKDNSNDLGLTGISGTGGGGDQSPDIWVRNYPDGSTVHQNPEFTDGEPCYVYVRVINKSCYPSEGDNRLKLYWSKAASSSSWPANWDGSSPETGNLIDDLAIPILQPGESTILQFTWNMLNPHDNLTWNSCLLARIESAIDNQTPYTLLADDITENNNVSIKNVTIIDQVLGLGNLTIAQVLSGNVTEEGERYNFNIDLAATPSGKPNIFNEAEVTITFDDLGWQLFSDAGAFRTPGIKVIREKRILITDSVVRFVNIPFPANKRIPLVMNVNFLSKKLTNTTHYAFTWEQYRSDDLKKLGTETFEVLKGRTDKFTANAGNDVTVEAQTEVDFSAQTITENAHYNWYDANDSLIYSGSDFSMLQQLTQVYKLEVIRLSDGLKDYDEKQVAVTENYLKNISPVPAVDNLTIDYDVSTLTNAYISFVNVNTGASASYVLDTNATSKTLDVSLWQNGIYTLYLVSNGVVMETQFMVVNH